MSLHAADTLTDTAAGLSAIPGRVADTLRAGGVPLTLQRLAIGQVLFSAPVHMTADEVLSAVKAIMPEISRATVYNNLKLFVQQHLLRELYIDAERTVFDSNTSPHHHCFVVDTGELVDIPAGTLKVVGAAELPTDYEVDAVEVIMRVRKKST